MFEVKRREMKDSDTVKDTKIIGIYADRESAKKFIEESLKGFDNSDYNGMHDYWWGQKKSISYRFTIELPSVA